MAEIPYEYLKSKKSILDFLHNIKGSTELREDYSYATEDGVPFIEGSFLFMLKDTHGFPLEVAIDTILSRNLFIRWISFIEAARKNLWWDFQTIPVVEHALQDAGCTREYIQNVIDRLKIYSYSVTHPELKENQR